VYVAAGVGSAAVTIAFVVAGLIHSLAAGSRLPGGDLRYMPHLREMVDSGRLEEASDELHMASLLDPGNVVALDMLARVSGELGQHRRQLHALRLLLLDTDSPQLRLRYSRAVVDHARKADREPPRLQLERAISSAEMALQNDPSSALAHATICEAWLLLGDAREAQRHLEEALRLDPTLESARRDLERALETERRS